MSKFILKKSQEPHDFRITDLELKSPHEVDHPLTTGRPCDSTKAGRVKRRIAKVEVCIVQNVDERRLDFKAHRLPNRESLRSAHVNIEECPGV